MPSLANAPQSSIISNIASASPGGEGKSAAPTYREYLSRETAEQYLREIDLSEGLQHDAVDVYAVLLLLSELKIDRLAELPRQLPEPPSSHCDKRLLSKRYQVIKELEGRIPGSDQSDCGEIVN